MPRGDKSRYSDKQKHQAERIEESYEARGVDHKEAEARAWATVNKQSGGGEKSGGGRKVAKRRKAGARKNSARRAVATKRGQSPNGGPNRGRASSRRSHGRRTPGAARASR